MYIIKFSELMSSLQEKTNIEETLSTRPLILLVLSL